jgi:hypothetical protein
MPDQSPQQLVTIDTHSLLDVNPLRVCLSVSHGTVCERKKNKLNFCRSRFFVSGNLESGLNRRVKSGFLWLVKIG